jgi:N-acetylglucosaminyl-diphospho-decaprenol L-rhamnosyltransferase
LLRACLESLQAGRQGIPFETIVVDNASTDGAPEMVARDFPDVVLIRNATNLGFARANNQAAAVARGRYLFFLNNDTETPAGGLQRLLEFADSHADASLIGPRLRDALGAIQVSHRQRPTVPVLLHRSTLLRWTGLFRQAHRRYRRGRVEDSSPRQVEILMGAAMLLKREVFDKIGGWDEGFVFGGEDMDLSMRAGAVGPVLYYPGVEILHHGRVSTRLHSRYSATNIPVGFVRYLRKSGTSVAAILAYKVVMTFDAPVQIVEKCLQGAWRWLRRRYAEARRSWLVARSLGHFLLYGLPAFWKA